MTQRWALHVTRSKGPDLNSGSNSRGHCYESSKFLTAWQNAHSVSSLLNFLLWLELSSSPSRHMPHATFCPIPLTPWPSLFPLFFFIPPMSALLSKVPFYI